MNDLEIAPLAQRLAEENNVDWRRLQGSGANGRIVERDVLAFLARVMAGEEAVDPTPEPLPDGMEAWPDASGPGAPSPRPAGYAAGDDAPATAPAASTGPGSGGAGADALAEDEDLLLAGDDLAPADEGDLLAPPEGPAPAPQPVPDEDLPDLFDDGGATAAEDDAPDLFDGDLSWDADDTPSRAEADPAPARGGGYDAPSDAGRQASRDDDALDFEGFPGADAPRGTSGEAAADASDADAWGADAWGDGEPDLGRPVADAGADAPASAEPSWSLGDEDPGLDPDQGPLAPVADLGAHAAEEGEPARTDLGGVAPAGDGDDRSAASVDAPEATLTFGGEEERADAAARQDGFGATGGGDVSFGEEAPSGADAGAAPATAAASAAAGLPLARSRQVLRRHVDFGGALALQRMLAADTGRDDLAVPALLLLAARRAGPLLGVGRPGLVQPAAEGGVTATVVRGDGLGVLAQALAAGTDDSGADADLWVADLSGYGLDDAVLDADVLQLTLGRILSDGDDGRVRATLALAGDVPLDRGAAFLARIAELIEEPLRLLL